MSEPRFCGGMAWEAALGTPDPWRCTYLMTEFIDGDRTDHLCAASYDHPGEHCCVLGHRWPQQKPRRSDRRTGPVFWLLLAGCTALGLLGILQGWVPV